MTSKGLSWRMTGVSLTPLRYRPRPAIARRTRPGAPPATPGHGLVPDPVTVFTFVHEDATHMGEGRLNAIECAGIYPPNREK